MAIAPAVPGLEVTIEVDNVALPEHQCEDDDVTTTGHEAFANSVVKYLEVPSGAEFSVHWLLKEPFDTTIPTYAGVMIDGTYLQAPFREAGDRDGDRGYKYAKSSFEEGEKSYTQNFRFSELEVGQ